MDTAGGGTMLVLNENDQLQSLLAKAQRGEITLVAQPCGDGNYILQESIENEQQQSSSEYIAHATTSSVGNLTKNASTTIQASKEVITAEITDEYQVENMADENIGKVKDMEYFDKKIGSGGKNSTIQFIYPLIDNTYLFISLHI